MNKEKMVKKKSGSTLGASMQSKKDTDGEQKDLHLMEERMK